MANQHYEYPSSSLHLFGMQDRPLSEPSHRRVATSSFPSFPYPSPPSQPHPPLQAVPSTKSFPSYGHSGSTTPEEEPIGEAEVVDGIAVSQEVESDSQMESPPSSGSEKVTLLCHLRDESEG